MNDLLFFLGSQEYVAAGRIPFMWAQSLYVISQLLKDSFIACGELDPINRRLSSLQRPEVIVQVVVLAKDEKIKDLLNQVKQLDKYLQILLLLYLLEVLRGPPIKLIQLVTSAEFHEL